MVFMTACGYKPSAKFARAVVGEKISTSVKISLVDPENTVIIKDAVDAAIINVFHASLVPKSDSQTHLVLQLSNPSYTPIQYDSDGFIVAYRTTINLRILRTSKNETKNYVAKGTYDFSITPNAVISDKERFDAIKFSSEKAIRAFVAQVSAEGTRKNTSVSVSDEVKNQDKQKNMHVESQKKQFSNQNMKGLKLETQEQKNSMIEPVGAIRKKLNSIEEAYYMKEDGLISNDEFESLKKEILTK